MNRKLLINALTLSRFALGLLFVHYILISPDQIFQIAVLYAVICLTDLLDGRLARKLCATSKTGAVLDVFADLFFITASCLALIVNNAFPAWMLAVILLKFIEFWYTSSFARKLKIDGGRVFLFDQLGRIVVVVFYLLPFAAILFQHLLPHGQSLLIINSICIPVAIGAIISSLYRINAFVLQRELLN